MKSTYMIYFSLDYYQNSFFTFTVIKHCKTIKAEVQLFKGKTTLKRKTVMEI